MKIGILSREEKSYSTQRLKEAGLQRGHKIKVFDTLKFAIHVEKNKPSLHYDNKPLAKLDAIIPRIGASITFFGTAVTRQFEQMGVYSLNSSLGITISRDKLRAIQVMSRHNLGIPNTVFVKDKKAIIPSIESIAGNSPVVIKLLEGTQGIGVILADSKKVAEAIIETLQSTKQNVLIQQFIKESKGRDIRAFVVGGKVVASMRRIAQGDEFRSNIHRGGRVEKVKLNPEYEETAIKAAQIMGLNVAGVDMLEGKKGPLIMEVNSSPGLEGIEEASQVDIATEIIKEMEHQVLFPEVDIRQRLTLKSGYGIAEVVIDRNSPFSGKTIQASGIREHDILILTLTRGTIPIPNPKGSREILPGDVLLCFGKVETIKSLLPTKKKSERKK
jgi:ribosomal protein S6--L-glutamate ligase